MLCDRCKERQANIHLTQVVNDKHLELNLCESCYQKEAGKFNLLAQPDLNFNNLLASFLQPAAEETRPEPVGEGQCANCGLTFTDFAKAGQLGCSECYGQFSANLEPVLRRIQGNTTHVGKVPRRTGGQVLMRKEISALKERIEGEVVDVEGQVQDKFVIK